MTTLEICGIKGTVPWFDLHSSAHPVPFIGAEHVSHATFTSLYAQLGTQETSHPGHPEAKELEPVVKLGFHHTVPTSFQRETAPSSGRARSVTEVAKELYRRAPSAAQRCGGQGGAFRDKTIALLCRELLLASDVATSVLPVRIHVDYHEPIEGAVQQYAILFTACGRQHLLPLSVMLCGSAAHARDNTRNALLISKVAGGWYVADPRANTADYPLSKSRLAMRAATQAARDKFKRSPILVCGDVDILGTGRRDEPWAPRRYSDVWYIYQDMASFDHYSRMTNYELHRSPLYKREGYSSLLELVQRILSISMTVSWTGSSVPTRPFQHIALDIFDLHEQSFRPVPSGTALDLSDRNDEDDNEGLENDSDDERDQEDGVEEGNQDVVLDPLHHQHPHQYRGIRAFRRREAQIRWANITAPVDGKPTCGLFQHCHLPQEHGLYCQYHSLSLDRYPTWTLLIGQDLDHRLRIYQSYSREVCCTVHYFDPNRAGPGPTRCSHRLPWRVAGRHVGSYISLDNIYPRRCRTITLVVPVFSVKFLEELPTR
ncbi:hypothetical protein BJ546DRAFT_362840 [Cryomyces antarcticus]